MTPQFGVGGRVSHPLPGCRIKLIRQAIRLVYLPMRRCVMTSAEIGLNLHIHS
jgi:hypothetical protein